MSAMDILGATVQRLESGDMPTTRDAVGDCLLACLKEILDQYMEGKTGLSRELDALIKAAGNTADPVIADIDPGTYQMISMVRTQLRNQKEAFHAARPKEEAGSEGQNKTG